MKPKQLEKTQLDDSVNSLLSSSDNSSVQAASAAAIVINSMLTESTRRRRITQHTIKRQPTYNQLKEVPPEIAEQEEKDREYKEKVTVPFFKYI